MSTFAIIDDNNFVTQVQRITQDVIDTGAHGNPATFVQTSFNTRGGIHYGENGNPSADQSKALRGNYAGIGYHYDPTVVINGIVGVFYPPQPYASWVLNRTTWLWDAPVPMPGDGKIYRWEEASLSWVNIALPEAA